MPSVVKIMSRIGKTPITIPKEVTIEKQADQVTVKGSKGSLTVAIPTEIQVTVKDSQIWLNERKPNKAIYGLTRALLANAVHGVNQGWQKDLELVGVGFRAGGGGSELTLNVGFTHSVKLTAPDGITFTITGNNQIAVSGADKQLVGEVAAKLHAVKPPEPYKGKGIRYKGEVVRKKAGKTMKAVGAPA